METRWPLTVMLGVLMLFGISATTYAATMFAGPLYPNGISDSCDCQIVNVSSGTKTIEIEVLNKTGGIIVQSGSISLQAGDIYVLSSGTPGAQYCKFINVSPTYFRAMIGCFFNGTNFVTL